MRKRFYVFALMFALPAGLYAAMVYQGGGAGKAQPAKPAAGAASAHVTVAAAELQWTPMFLGLERAVVSGDPNASGVPFVMRLRAKKGATIPAHWHPTDENITVLAGTLRLGVGDKLDPMALHALTAGTYSFMPKNTRHFGTFTPGSVIQIHGTGPFLLNFVNPADDPRKPATP